MNTVNFFANIVGHTGYTTHARHFAYALNKLIPVCLLPKYGPLSEEHYEKFGEMLGRLLDIDLHATSICLDYPEEMYRFGGSRRIGYTVFETQILNQAGVHQLAQLDQVWVPTHWGKNILVENGIEEEMIRVIPEGADTSIYKPGLTPFSELNKPDEFRFLSVGKWEERKNVVTLLKAFDAAFEKSDQVKLVVYFLSQVQALSQIQVREEIDKLGLENRENIIVIETLLPTEAHMAILYNSCHAFVSASHAEGWCLPLTEAMACGLPVIAPFYSGPTEFLNPEVSFPIEVTELEDVYCPLFFPEKGAFGKWAKISQEALIEKMRYVTANREKAKTIGQKAAREIETKWTWDKAAEKAFQALNETQSFSC